MVSHSQAKQTFLQGDEESEVDTRRWRWIEVAMHPIPDTGRISKFQAAFDRGGWSDRAGHSHK